MTWRAATHHGVAAAVAAALLVAGCAATVAPPPASTLQVPAAWRTAVQQQGSGPVAQQWWQNFGDPAMTALIDQALQNNGDLRVARARVAQYRALVGVAEAGQKANVSVDTAPT